jgi:hypothetical protein
VQSFVVQGVEVMSHHGASIPATGFLECSQTGVCDLQRSLRPQCAFHKRTAREHMICAQVTGDDARGQALGFIRGVGAAIGGLLGLVGVLLFLVLVEVGGISYRKDCLTNQGTVSQSWTFTWFAPIPFLFRPSQQGCVVHTGTRVALNAIGIDTFKPSTPESIAGQGASSAGVDPYWPKLRAVLVELSNQPQSGSLSDHIAALVKARDAVASLSPPAPYAAAHQNLVATMSALVASGQELRTALQHRDRQTEAAILNLSQTETASFKSDVAELDRVHSTQ